METDLLPELLPAIGKSLDSSLDVIRFRSVCRAWRSALPVSEANFFSHHTLHLPWISTLDDRKQYPLSGGDCDDIFSYLVRSTVCSFRLPAAELSSSPWLVSVVETSEFGNKSLSDCVSQVNLHGLVKPITLNPASFDLSFYTLAIKQHSRSYILVEKPGPRNWAHPAKALMYPDSVWSNDIDRSVLTLPSRTTDSKVVRLWRTGDKKWTKLENPTGSSFHDIASLNDRFFAVDAVGIIFRIDTRAKELVQCSSPLRAGHRPWISNRLMVSGRDFYLVETIFVASTDNVQNRRKQSCFKIHILNKETGCWVEVRELGGQALVLGVFHSLFVSTNDFLGCKANCIYYHTDIVGGITSSLYTAIAKYDMDKRTCSIETFLNVKPVWPPSPLLDRGLADLSLCWTPPPINCFKFNVAGAPKFENFGTRDGKKRNFNGAGMGGVLRNCNGAVISTFSKQLDTSVSRERAHLFAVLEALQHASQSDWGSKHDLIIESDSSVVVSWFCDPNTRPQELMDYFVAADQMILLIKQVTFIGTSIQANTFAMVLARDRILTLDRLGVAGTCRT